MMRWPSSNSRVSEGPTGHATTHLLPTVPLVARSPSAVSVWQAEQEQIFLLAFFGSSLTQQWFSKILNHLAW